MEYLKNKCNRKVQDLSENRRLQIKAVKEHLKIYVFVCYIV